MITFSSNVEELLSKGNLPVNKQKVTTPTDHKSHLN